MDNEQMLKVIMDLMDKMDKRFDALDNRLDGMDQRFDTMDITLEIMDEKLDRIERGQQEDIQSMLKLINGNVDRISYELDYLSEKTGRHDTKINTLEKKIRT